MVVACVLGASEPRMPGGRKAIGVSPAFSFGERQRERTVPVVTTAKSGDVPWK